VKSYLPTNLRSAKRACYVTFNNDSEDDEEGVPEFVELARIRIPSWISRHSDLDPENFANIDEKQAVEYVLELADELLAHQTAIEETSNRDCPKCQGRSTLSPTDPNYTKCYLCTNGKTDGINVEADGIRFHHAGMVPQLHRDDFTMFVERYTENLTALTNNNQEWRRRNRRGTSYYIFVRGREKHEDGYVGVFDFNGSGGRVFLNQNRILPAFRGQGVFPALLALSVKYCSESIVTVKVGGGFEHLVRQVGETSSYLSSLGFSNPSEGNPTATVEKLRENETFAMVEAGNKFPAVNPQQVEPTPLYQILAPCGAVLAAALYYFKG